MKNKNQQNLKFRKENSTFRFLFFTFCLLLISTFYFLNSNVAQAQNASLYLLPSTGNYTIGGIFSVEVKVSAGIPINAAEGSLIFNTEELNVVSLSKSGSIFTLWTTEPTFSNSAGTIEFAGGTPTSFVGATGTIVTINFKAKSGGTTNVNFISGAVLAADGKATNILARMSGGTYNLRPGIITPPAEEEYVPPPTPTGIPLAPIVSSSTHPDPEKWYSNNNPEFSWKLPSDVSEVSLLLHKNPTADPGPISDGKIESKKYEDVEDGIWYFHIKFQNQYGWGQILHRKVLIDTISPKSFNIELQRKDLLDPQPIFLFGTTDETSGVEYYEIKIDQGEPAVVSAGIKEISYQILPQTSGKHLAKVKAFDKAGNFSLATAEFEVLSTPVFLKFGKIAIDYLTIIVTLIILIVGVIAIIFYPFYRISLWRKRLRVETKEVAQAVYKAFRSLRKEIQNQVEYLDGNPDLTEEQKEVRDKLKKALDVSEKFIEKEIKDIEKELG